MKTLYMHIGTPKTGTSAIQYFCCQNHEALLKKGLCYPDLGFSFPGIGSNRNAHFLSHRVLDEQNRRLPEEEKKIWEQGLNRLEELFTKHDCVVISDEHIWNEKEMNKERLESIRERMKSVGVTVRVIVYLRRQEQVIQSYWAQQVKEGLQLSFSEYMKEGRYRYFQLNYEKRLHVFADVFGRENVIVRCYEKGQYLGREQTIISDFLHIFGIALDDELKEGDLVKNPSLQGIYLQVKCLLNANPVFSTKRNFSVPLLQKVQQAEEDGVVFTQGDGLSKKEVEEYLSKYIQKNEAVAKTYLGREDGTLFYDPIVQSEEKVEYKEGDMVAICGKMIALQDQEIKRLKRKLERNTLRGRARRIYHKIRDRGEDKKAPEAQE